MPRGARLDAPGTLHHVMVRGIEKRKIVDDDEDRENFISRIGEVGLETGTSIFAWTLMDNHAHILLKSGVSGLSAFMRRLLGGYAASYNRRALEQEMPRGARLDAPGTLHHVMVRGIEKRKIVDDDEDRENFISRIGEVGLETGIESLYFCMDAHGQPRSYSTQERSVRPIGIHAPAARGICGILQSAAQTSRAFISKQVQVNYLRGRSLFQGTGSLYSSEFLESGDCRHPSETGSV